MTHKDKVRKVLNEAIEGSIDVGNPSTRLKAILGIANVVAEYDTYLSLLLGEQVALIEIQKQGN